jgi:hypothetical protein
LCSKGFFHACPTPITSVNIIQKHSHPVILSEAEESRCEAPHEGFPDWDEPTLLKTLQCMVLVGEMSLQQQVLQAVPENGVALAPFETDGSAIDTD